MHGILSLTRLKELEFSHDITVFAGENGMGKSTLLEAIAVAAGFNREGGTINFMHSTYDDVSELQEVDWQETNAVRVMRDFLAERLA